MLRCGRLSSRFSLASGKACRWGLKLRAKPKTRQPEDSQFRKTLKKFAVPSEARKNSRLLIFPSVALGFFR